MHASKNQIDKAGAYLASPKDDFDEAYLETYVQLEQVFDEFRESHLSPLTSLTAILQEFLAADFHDYYVAQRLKRKPQIIRKLGRLHVRLTQLQDIGGLRIIVPRNSDVANVCDLIDKRLSSSTDFELVRTTDYRAGGRDDSGYRAVHKIVRYKGLFLEVQIRSRAQHHWAESVERTSVFYGKRLKEGEGSRDVLSYFKLLALAYSDLESGRRLSTETRKRLEDSRQIAERVISQDGYSYLTEGSVDESVIKTLVQKGKSAHGQLTNWILVFNWNTASFVTWESASRRPDEAVAQYTRYEKDYPEREHYEVVLIGASDISTVQKTHSHYFGISRPDTILEELGVSVPSMSDDETVDTGAKLILSRLVKRRIWGMSQGVQRQTLQNHFCPEVETFAESLDLLIREGYVVDKRGAGVTLNKAKSSEIESLI